MLKSPKKFAAIDIGSNGVRLFIGRVAGQRVVTIEDVRLPIRLGDHSFHGGFIQKNLIYALTRCIQQYVFLARKHEVIHITAVATSALRDAKNSFEVLNFIWSRTGLRVELIDGLEEAKLLHLAVQKQLRLEKEPAFLMDMGGGSLEIVITNGVKIRHAFSLKLGTVRLIRQCGVDASYGDYARVVKKELGKLLDVCDVWSDLIKPTQLIGTGGCLRALARINNRLRNRPGNFRVGLDDMEDLSGLLFELSHRQRILSLNLKPDRADVIRPAAVIALEIMKNFSFPLLRVPNVGIKNGVFWQLAASTGHGVAMPLASSPSLPASFR